MNTHEVEAFLDAHGLDRQWLADELGCAKGTLNNWCSSDSFPLWAEKGIARIMRDKDRQGLSAGNEDAWKFSLDQFRLFEAARIKAGLSSIEEFLKLAGDEYARQLIAQRPKSSSTGEEQAGEN